MSDSYGEPQQQGAQGDGSRGDGYRGEGGRGGGRGGRGPGNREGGGFRIRLSENEMRSARALQEAFNLRSTVAVLGFALRTLGQMLEDGQLDELIEQQRNQAPRGRREGGGRDGGGRDGGGRGRRSDDDRQGGRGSRPDPFARPAKPQPEPEPTPEPESTPEEAAPSDAPAEDTPAEVSTDLPNEEESKAATPEA
ncbi:hypothetical protein [Synechococcus sp. A15-24]|uniref:hypothetical protein n=1 Tax=Synechococcus sp. A15-24 TaxID=1050635 RepID=UPI0016458B15|nr:hypothetical protein [Synechococcus sp. A15-24]QNJ29309.1 hypothetical protein SynA1524_01611 [Synechococcus sp. A15-24]